MSIASNQGNIPFSYKGELYHTYFEVHGELSKYSTPVVVLHSGPGLIHDYLAPVADLAKTNTPIIFYDQLGNGKSTHLSQKPQSFWTIDLFIEELVNILKYLKIEDNFALLAHAWGSVIVTEYEVRKQPRGLRCMVLTSPYASWSDWNNSNMQLVKGFSADVQEGFMSRMNDPAKFWAALQKFFVVHGCMVKPLPKVYWETMEHVFGANGDSTVSSAAARMLKDWTIKDRLDRIHVPVLILNGRKDIAQDDVVQPFVEKVKHVTRVKFDKSSHTLFLEEPAKYIQVVGDFLKAN